jgi:hypothetical protein
MEDRHLVRAGTLAEFGEDPNLITRTDEPPAKEDTLYGNYPYKEHVWSLRYGKSASSNPWGATGLEWTTHSPPPQNNFETTPLVTSEPYSTGISFSGRF